MHSKQYDNYLPIMLYFVGTLYYTPRCCTIGIESEERIHHTVGNVDIRYFRHVLGTSEGLLTGSIPKVPYSITLYILHTLRVINL